MKLNWGTGIAIVYTVFVLALIFALIRSATVDRSLVSDDYYQKDLHYQAQIDKEVNAMNLEEDLQVNFTETESAVRFEFPSGLGEVEGSILFFRPSDEDLDFETPIRTDASGVQTISTQNLVPGLWKVKVNWTAGGVEYYKEETIVL